MATAATTAVATTAATTAAAANHRLVGVAVVHGAAGGHLGHVHCALVTHSQLRESTVADDKYICKKYSYS